MINITSSNQIPLLFTYCRYHTTSHETNIRLIEKIKANQARKNSMLSPQVVPERKPTRPDTLPVQRAGVPPGDLVDFCTTLMARHPLYLSTDEATNKSNGKKSEANDKGDVDEKMEERYKNRNEWSDDLPPLVKYNDFNCPEIGTITVKDEQNVDKSADDNVGDKRKAEDSPHGRRKQTKPKKAKLDEATDIPKKETSAEVSPQLQNAPMYPQNMVPGVFPTVAGAPQNVPSGPYTTVNGVMYGYISIPVHQILPHLQQQQIPGLQQQQMSHHLQQQQQQQQHPGLLEQDIGLQKQHNLNAQHEKHSSRNSSHPDAQAQLPDDQSKTPDSPTPEDPRFRYQISLPPLSPPDTDEEMDSPRDATPIKMSQLVKSVLPTSPDIQDGKLLPCAKQASQVPTYPEWSKSIGKGYYTNGSPQKIDSIQFLRKHLKKFGLQNVKQEVASDFEAMIELYGNERNPASVTRQLFHPDAKHQMAGVQGGPPIRPPVGDVMNESVVWNPKYNRYMIRHTMYNAGVRLPIGQTVPDARGTVMKMPHLGKSDDIEDLTLTDEEEGDPEARIPDGSVRIPDGSDRIPDGTDLPCSVRIPDDSHINGDIMSQGEADQMPDQMTVFISKQMRVPGINNQMQSVVSNQSSAMPSKMPPLPPRLPIMPHQMSTMPPQIASMPHLFHTTASGRPTSGIQKKNHHGHPPLQGIHSGNSIQMNVNDLDAILDESEAIIRNVTGGRSDLSPFVEPKEKRQKYAKRKHYDSLGMRAFKFHEYKGPKTADS